MTKRILPSNQQTELFQRVATYYTELAETESAKGLEGYHNLDMERTQLLQVLEGCHERGEWETVNNLAGGAVDGYLDMRGYSKESVIVNTAGLKSAQQLGHRKNEGAWLGNLGLAYSHLGQVEQAIEFFQQALLISREIGNRRGEGADLGNLGSAYRDLGQVEQAIEFYQQALLISREIGNRRGEGADLGNLGLAYSDLGQMDKAIEFYEQALLIAREIGDRRGEGADLGNLGLAYSNLGQVDKAIEFYQQALLISREIGDRRGEGNHVGNLGVAYRDLGQVDKAIEFFQQALLIAREIGDRQGEGNWLGNLGLIHLQLTQMEKASKYFLKSQSIFDDLHLPVPPKIQGGLISLQMPGCLLLPILKIGLLINRLFRYFGLMPHFIRTIKSLQQFTKSQALNTPPQSA